MESKIASQLQCVISIYYLRLNVVRSDFGVELQLLE